MTAVAGFAGAQQSPSEQGSSTVAAASPSHRKPAVPSINSVLADHQCNDPGWDLAPIAQRLHEWAGRFISEFKLDIGVPALRIERLRCLGYYDGAPNEFGLMHEIAIDKTHALEDPLWSVLDSLLHECLHFWQEVHGRPGRCNYHNAEFRKKALELGLQIDQRGVGGAIGGDTAFWRLLSRYGIDQPSDLTQPSRPTGPGSKLKLYECSCGFKVRVARQGFRSLCLNCNTEFIAKF